MVIFFLYCVAILLAEFDCKLILHSILFDKDGTGKNHNCSFSSQNKSIFSIVKNIFFFLIQYFFMTGISAIKELIKGTKETCLFTLYNSEFNSEIALIRHYYKSVHFSWNNISKIVTLPKNLSIYQTPISNRSLTVRQKRQKKN